MNQHIKTPKHELRKEKLRSSQTLEDLEKNRTSAINENQSFIQDLFKTSTISAIPRNKIDGPFGSLLRKWVPAAKSLPSSRRLRSYITPVFESLQDQLSQKLIGQDVILIWDESPDILKRPHQHILASFYDKDEVKKSCELLSSIHIKRVKSSTIYAWIGECLYEYQLSYNSIIAIASDSAEYMNKLVKDMREIENRHIIHIRDAAHPIHNVLIKAIDLKCFSEVKEFVLMVGPNFNHSYRQINDFQELLTQEDFLKPEKVVKHCWFSFYSACERILKIPYHVEFFLENNYDHVKFNIAKNPFNDET